MIELAPQGSGASGGASVVSEIHRIDTTGRNIQKVLASRRAAYRPVMLRPQDQAARLLAYGQASRPLQLLSSACHLHSCTDKECPDIHHCLTCLLAHEEHEEMQRRLLRPRFISTNTPTARRSSNRAVHRRRRRCPTARSQRPARWPHAGPPRSSSRRCNKGGFPDAARSRDLPATRWARW
ncbi:hypothetical protein D3C78_487580 [compost metagenome]